MVVKCRFGLVLGGSRSGWVQLSVNLFLRCFVVVFHYVFNCEKIYFFIKEIICQLNYSEGFLKHLK